MKKPETILLGTFRGKEVWGNEQAKEAINWHELECAKLSSKCLDMELKCFDMEQRFERRKLDEKSYRIIIAFIAFCCGFILASIILK